MSLTIGSLFSGIGGLELGLERGLAAAGVPTRTLWQVEQNDYARAVLARHWPHAKRYTDVRDITAKAVQPIDLLAGGFPCQDISTAGKGAGLAGERSGLFFEMARIVRELRPRIVVMENVPAITARGLDTVLGTLAALGYAARWGGLRASEVGSPHRRERWFCVAWLADTSCVKFWRKQNARTMGYKSGLSKINKPTYRCAVSCRGEAMADTDSRRRDWWQTEPGMGRNADGLSSRLDPHRWPAPLGPQHPWEPPRTRPRQPHDRDRLKALGNAVVPQCAEIIGRWIGCELVERL